MSKKKLLHIESAGKVYKIPQGVRFVAFDGCHKFYILETEDDVEEAKAIGYENFVPIDQLAETFGATTCGLRFINTMQLEPVVLQFDDAKFVFKGGEVYETEFYKEWKETNAITDNHQFSGGE